MQLAPGPRPLAIKVFAGLFIIAALIDYSEGLLDLETSGALLAVRFPRFDWNSDWVIIALSAKFTIAIIPVALIVLRALGFARFLVLIFFIPSLFDLPQVLPHWFWGSFIAPAYLAATTLKVFSVALLFTPSASDWFQSGRTKAHDASVFE